HFTQCRPLRTNWSAREKSLYLKVFAGLCPHVPMTTRNYQARVAGFLYLLMSATSTFAFSTVPSWSTNGRGLQHAAEGIAAAPFHYRIGVVCDLASQVFFIALVLVLYELFKGVNRRLALLMVALVLAQVPMAFANLLLGAAPLALQ